MPRGASTLRLTGRELSRWAKITGFTPADVRSEEDLARFAARCKRHFWGRSEDTRFLHLLIDEELRRNLLGGLTESVRDQVRIVRHGESPG
jgi:hypothetical protein